MKNFLVIGGGGYIGIRLVKELIKNGQYNVRVLSRKSNSSIDVLLQENSNLDFIKCDLLEIDTVKLNFSELDHIFYLASGTFPALSWQSPSLEIDKSILPFFSLMEALVEVNYSKNFTFISSGGTVYGDAPIKENGYTESCPTLPFVPYGIFKRTQEDLLRHYQKKLGLKLYIYRVGNVYGPNESIQKEYGVINIWLKNILANEPINIFGSGEIIRDYIFIDDLAKILTLSESTKSINPGIYNLSSGSHPSLNEIITLISTLTAIPIKVKKLDRRGPDANRVVLDGSLFNSQCSFNYTPLDRGIQQTLDFLRTHVGAK